MRLGFISLVHRFCEALAQQHRYQEVLPAAERLVREEPYDEAALRRLMQCYQNLGRRGHALQAYERFANEVCPELGLPPDPSTQLLAQTIRDACPVLRPVAAVGSGRPDAAALLENARAAFLRGAHAEAEAALLALKTGIPEVDGHAVRHLEIDLALRCHDVLRAEQVLQACADQGPGTLLRRAGLALAHKRWQAAAAQATEALLAANMLQDRNCEARAL